MRKNKQMRSQFPISDRNKPNRVQRRMATKKGRPLRYGDFIRLIIDADELVLGAEGVINNDCRAIKLDSLGLDYSVFCVYVGYQYSAAKELKDYLSVNSGDGELDKNESHAAHLKALTRGLTNEQKENEASMKQRFGEAVKYGDTIQLQHSLSRKFITVQSFETAESEHQNLKVQLDSLGNDESHIKLMARLRIDEVGDVIDNSEIFLRGCGVREQFIHSAREPISESSIAFSARTIGSSNYLENYKSVEVNCSLDKTPWRIQIFDSPEKGPYYGLRARDVVCINDPDSKMALQLNDPYVMFNTLSIDSFLFDTYLRSSDCRYRDSNTFWIIEFIDFNQGGPVIIGGIRPHSIRLRHLNSGRYLNIRRHSRSIRKDASRSSIVPSDDRSISSSRSNSVSSIADMLDATFENAARNSRPDLRKRPSFSTVNALADLGIVSSPRLSSRNTSWDDLAEKVDNKDDTESTFKRGKVKAVVDNCLVVSTVDNPQSSGSSINILDHRDFLNCNEAERQLLTPDTALIIEMERMWLKSANATDLSVLQHPSANKDDMRLERILSGVTSNDCNDFNDGEASMILCVASLSKEQATTFVMERVSSDLVADALIGVASFPYFTSFLKAILTRSGDGVTSHADNFNSVVNNLNYFLFGSSNVPTESRQRLLREQGILSITLDILVALQESDQQTDKSTPSENEDLSRFKVAIDELKRPVARALFQLLLNAVLRYTDNQLFAAKRISVFVAFSEVESGATDCIVEMLSNNRFLQESQVSERSVKVFVSLLRRNPMHPLFLDLLKATCEDMGQGIHRNQDIVANLLLRDATNDDIFLSLRLNDTGSVCVSWLIDDAAEFNAAALYGKDIVPLHEIFAVSSEESVKALKRTMSIGSQYSMARSRVINGSTSTSAETESHIVDDSSSQGLMKIFPRRPSGSSDVVFNPLSDSLNTEPVDSFSSRTSVENMRRSMIADYLVHQLLLLSSLCRSRNHATISLLKNDYPYDLLVAVIMDHRLSSELRSAAVTLVTCLHVDVSPQFERIVPNMIRCWDGVQVEVEEDSIYVQTNTTIPGERTRIATMKNAAEESSFSMHFVSSDNKAKTFDDLKGVTIAHLNTLARLGGDLMTIATMSLLEKLIKFNFFSTESQLDSVNRTVLWCLDDRRTSSLSTVAVDADVGKQLLKKDKLDWNLFSTLKRLKPKEVLDFLESVKVMSFVVAVVISYIILAIWTEMSNTDPSWLFIVDTSITSFFICELSLRYFCWVLWHRFSRESFKSFWTFFRCVDGLLVLTDIILFIIYLGVTDTSKMAKLARFIRIVRLALKVIRLARVANMAFAFLQRMRAEDSEKFVLPSRYDSTPSSELMMMHHAVEVLNYTSRVARDIRLTRFLQAFKVYTHVQMTHAKNIKFEELNINYWTRPTEIVDYIIDSSYRTSTSSSESGELSDTSCTALNSSQYNFKPLIHAALTLLMDSALYRSNLIKDAKGLVLTTTEADATVLGAIRKNVETLQSNMEVYALWKRREIQSEKVVADDVNRCLSNLASLLLEEHESGLPLPLNRPSKQGNQKSQRLLRHLNGTRILTEAFQKLLETLNEMELLGPSNVIAVAARNEIRATLVALNTVIGQYIRGNIENQFDFYRHINLFISTMDQEIQSVQVISEIFDCNEELINSVDTDFISTITDIITKSGFNPDCMRIFSAILQLHGAARPKLQAKILRELTLPGREAATLFLCQKPGSETYELRRSLCREVQARAADDPSWDNDDMQFSHLPPLLAYHITVVNILAMCARGRRHVNLVEAYLQSVYPLDDLLTALIDDTLLLEVRLALIRYLRQAFIDAKTTSRGLVGSKLLWMFFSKFPTELTQCLADARAFLFEFDPAPKPDSSPPDVCAAAGSYSKHTHQQKSFSNIVKAWSFKSRLRLDFILEVFIVLRIYFEEYFGTLRRSKIKSFEGCAVDIKDSTLFAADIQSLPGEDSPVWVAEQLCKILVGVKGLIELIAPFVTDTFLVEAVDMAETLLKRGPNQSSDMQLKLAPALWTLPDSVDSDFVARVRKNKIAHFSRWEAGISSNLVNSVSAQAKFIGTDGESRLVAEQLSMFLETIENDPDHKLKIRHELTTIAAQISGLPGIKASPSFGDIRIEVLIRRLVNYVLTCFKSSDVSGARHLDAEDSTVAKWIIQVFRSMIESKWGMSVTERGLRGGPKEDSAAYSTQLLLNYNNVTALCLDLISEGIEEDLKIEAINTLVALLYREGGNERVQTSIFYHHDSVDSSPFFIEVKQMLIELVDWHEANPDGLYGVDSLTLPDGAIILTFLKLTCEGHFLKNQEVLRTQNYDKEDERDSVSSSKLKVPNSTSENILDEMVVYLNVVSRLPFRVATTAATRVVVLILSVIQGPCEANQVYFTRQTDLLEIINRLLRSRRRNDQIEVEELKLKTLAVKVILALLEGRRKGDDFSSKIISTVHLDVLYSHVELPALKALAEFENLGAEGEILQFFPSNSIKNLSTNTDNPSDSNSFDFSIIHSRSSRERSVSSVSAFYRDDHEEEKLLKHQSRGKDELQTQVLELLSVLIECDPSIKHGKMMARLSDLLEKEIRSIEVVWRGKVQRHYFHVPAHIESLLGHMAKSNLLDAIDSSNEESKLIDFIKHVDDVYLELKWQEYLAQWGLHILFNRENQMRATWLSFFLALVENMIYLIGYRYRSADMCRGHVNTDLQNIYHAPSRSWNLHGPGDDSYSRNYMETPCLDPYGFYGAKMIGNALVAVSLFNLLLYLVVLSKLLFDKTLSRDIEFVAGRRSLLMARLNAAWKSISEGSPPALYYLAYLFTCFFVKSLYPPLCCLLLLDVAVKSKSTKYVLMAIYRPRKQLFMTVILLLICVYIFSVMYFFSFRLQNEYEDHESSLSETFINTLNYGLRMTGGAGDMYRFTSDSGRIAIDLLYLWVVLIILLNVVFGIIVDTFADLRERLAERKRLLQKYCFICGISSETFERAGQLRSLQGGASMYHNGWIDHYHKDHNMWNFAFFIVVIKNQRKEDDDGLERYVRTCLETENVKWFPANQALCLQNELSGDASLKESNAIDPLKLNKDDASNAKLHSIVDSISRRQSEVHQMLDAFSIRQNETTAKLAEISEILSTLKMSPSDGVESAKIPEPMQPPPPIPPESPHEFLEF